MKSLNRSIMALGLMLSITGQIMPLYANTAQPIEYPTISINVLKSNGAARTNYSVAFGADMSNQREQIYSAPVIIESGAQAKIGLSGKNLKTWQYQIIKSNTKPTQSEIENTEWKTVTINSGVTHNDPKSYPDLMLNKKGHISTKHYNYSFDSKAFSDGQTPERAKTFGTPIGKNMVIQTAATNTNNQYYNTEGYGAFMGGSNTGQTALKMDFKAPKTGIYKFSVYSNSGAKGDIVVNGVAKKIVDDLTTVNSKKQVVVTPSTANPEYHTAGIEVMLQEGLSYNINMLWEHKAKEHNAPVLVYQTKEGTTFSAYKTIEEENFVTAEYIGGANKAVKFWGYIIPEDTLNGQQVMGDYHLGSYSDDGAYGYLIIDGKPVVFVENWELKRFYNRSGVKGQMVPIKLEPGKAYPIYMEWYEGCPTEKAFRPVLKKANSSTWINMPSTWFYASSDTTPGDVNEAFFLPFDDDEVIDFGEEAGQYYVVTRVESGDGTVRQLLNGPFEIKGASGIVSNVNSPNKNNIVPESISNISYEVTFDEDAKKIKYEVDLGNIVDATIAGTTMMTFDTNTNKMVVTLNGNKINSSRLAYNNKKLTIDLLSEPTLNKGQKHTINIYLPTTFIAGIKYGGNSTTDTSTYVGAYLNPTKQAIIPVKITATPYFKELRDAAGNIIAEASEGDEKTTTKNVQVIYVSMPKIL